MNRAFRTALSAFALLGMLAGATTAAAAPAEKWQIQLSGQSTSAGELHLRVTPQAGEAVIVTVKIASSRGEMFMAKDVLAALKSQLAMPTYKSEIVHTRDVLLKAGHGQPSFTLDLVDSTVSGIKVIVTPA